MRLEAGKVLAAKMNAHRHQWNGSICAQPESWNCGASSSFRGDYCAAGESRCFHLDVFNISSPRFVIPDPTVIQAVREQPKLLDDQILVFYGGRFSAQQGIVQGDFNFAIYGLYRVKCASLEGVYPKSRLVVEPHRGSWAMFPKLKHGHLTLRSVHGVAYLKELRAKALTDIVDEALEEVSSKKVDGWTVDHEKNLRRVREQLPQWLQSAEEALTKLTKPEILPRVVVQAPTSPSAIAEQLSKLNLQIVPSTEISSGVELPNSEHSTSIKAQGPEEIHISTVIPDPGKFSISSDSENSGSTFTVEHEGVTQSGAASDYLPSAIPEVDARHLLAERLDPSMITSLSVAFLTKCLVILTGAPGSGKSWIASRLLDDVSRERTVIVPVASTWRGREDLLGYVNPITGGFEATRFTHFLCDAEEAWNVGDRRARLVVFEEFNLSQPEHWLSDLLVRLEYEPELSADRTLALGGNSIAGRPGRPCEVVLVPSLRLVATLNNDHTVKPLSPRVLDRSALIEVSSSGRAALERTGVTIADDLADLIDDLNDLIGSRGAAFSVRTARSLQRALASNMLKPTQALDLILAQEVLSRVRLLAGDPRDEQLLSRLQAWSQRPECADLAICAARIADWAETLSAGRDVFQA